MRDHPANSRGTPNILINVQLKKNYIIVFIVRKDGTGKEKKTLIRMYRKSDQIRNTSSKRVRVLLMQNSQVSNLGDVRAGATGTK
jgi:hypothetical protein